MQAEVHTYQEIVPLSGANPPTLVPLVPKWRPAQAISQLPAMAEANRGMEFDIIASMSSQDS